MFSHHKFFVITWITLVTISLASCTTMPILIPTDTPISATMVPYTATETLAVIATLAEEMIPTMEPNIDLYEDNTLASSLQNASRQEIVETLLHKWLEHLKTDQVSEYSRLKTYKIEMINPWDGYCLTHYKDTTKFISEVQLSVQTVAAHSEWDANASAVNGDDHWVYNINSYIGVYFSNDVYALRTEGIPPCSVP